MLFRKLRSAVAGIVLPTVTAPEIRRPNARDIFIEG